MPINYDEPRWTLREAAEAAGYDKVNTLRAYYQRGHFRIVGGEAAKARGLAGLLNLRDVMHLAVAQKLISIGIHPKAAFDAGYEFAHYSVSYPGGPPRDPTELYDPEKAFTVLIWQPGMGARIIPMYHRNAVIEFADLFVNNHTGQRGPAVSFLLNDVQRSVFLALNIGGAA